MFTSEEGAMKIVDAATQAYSEHFDEEFPLLAYVYMTKNKEYDFSTKGAKKLEKYINRHIKDDRPVPIPEGYSEHYY
jgi:hypothetical protein